ncbi:MAG: hypothetical protein PUH02_09590, partial [bacterium]|nr:hypothetical protein [bacterium]
MIKTDFPTAARSRLEAEWLLQLVKGHVIKQTFLTQHALAWKQAQWCVSWQNTPTKHQCLFDSCILGK